MAWRRVRSDLARGASSDRGPSGHISCWIYALSLARGANVPDHEEGAGQKGCASSGKLVLASGGWRLQTPHERRLARGSWMKPLKSGLEWFSVILLADFRVDLL